MEPSGLIFAALDCDADAIEEWNRWYDLEHTPMNVCLAGVMLSRRYVATPDLHAVRLTGEGSPFAGGRATFLTTYVLSGDPQDAFADALRCAHRVLLTLLACLALAALATGVLAALLWATRWPGVGAPLLAVVLPLAVLVLGGIAFALVVVVGPLAGPAVWAGRSTGGALALLRQRLRHGLPETALLVAAVYLLTALATAAVSFVVASGGRLMASLAILGAGVELPAGQLLAGLMGLGPRSLGASGVPLEGGPLGTAALVGGGVVFAIALVLPTLVWLRGCCAVYLAVTEPT